MDLALAGSILLFAEKTKYGSARKAWFVNKKEKAQRAARIGESEAHRRVSDSAGAITFREGENGLEALVIVMKRTRPSFPKGHAKPGETFEECALREVLEETGVTVELIPGFCRSVPSARPEDQRSVHFYLAEPADGSHGDCTPQLEEIDDALWMPVDEVERCITFEADRLTFLDALAEYQKRPES